MVEYSELFSSDYKLHNPIAEILLQEAQFN